MPFLNGRPTDYTDEMPNKVAEFVSLRLDKQKKPLTIAGLANYLGITSKTVYNWSEKHEEFLQSLEAFRDLDEDDTWIRALSGDYNSNIAKLKLANYGYSDKQQTENMNVNLNEDIPEGDPEERLKAVLTKIKELQDE